MWLHGLVRTLTASTRWLSFVMQNFPMSVFAPPMVAQQSTTPAMFPTPQVWLAFSVVVVENCACKGEGPPLTCLPFALMQTNAVAEPAFTLPSIHSVQEAVTAWFDHTAFGGPSVSSLLARHSINQLSLGRKGVEFANVPIACENLH